MGQIEFLDRNGTFRIQRPENYSGLYFPLAGEPGLKSSITPNLGGDSKTDQNHFLLEPVSIENLHNNRSTRNFWCCIKGKGCWSATGVSAEQEAQKFTDKQDESAIEAGFMWQTVTRTSSNYQIASKITSFVSIDGAVEVALVEITNKSQEEMTLTPIAAIPIYGRSADNIRDHRHVTSLLHRIATTEHGVLVTPVLSFDERGHQKNDTTYFVYGFTENAGTPKEFYPTVQEFIGEGGTYLNPEAVRTLKAGKKAGTLLEGKEAVGAIRFEEVTVKPQQTMSFLVLTGLTEEKEKIEEITSAYRTKEQVEAALKRVKEYWTQKVNVDYETSDPDTDNYLKWISFQPILRRIYGCSFLPYHDYGKGGRGWRDLWQDCLALLIMNPSGVRQMIIDNYGGVRIDGTNATIIGTKQGEFIADRNNITRVWMDHAFWPFITTKLYMDQTGDLEILFEKIPYFKDLQSKRGTDHDTLWTPKSGKKQKTVHDEVYHGTILEHILLENLCAFYDVGAHNEMRLHGADWNDALDMASENGESVAFTCAYAGNLNDIADCLQKLEKISGICRIEIAKEMECLFSSGTKLYENADQKRALLASYTEQCAHSISGDTIILKIADVCKNLREKADWMMNHIREREWILDGENGWFNSYYDNHKNSVDCCKKDRIRMMLTGQVFAIMSGTATEEQVSSICQSADRYLFDEAAGGYRLNTNFHEEKFDLGRMFGFAYGEKENGAVFSHMAVMYANALYKRGFVKEGYQVLHTLLKAAMDFKKSVMYPGLPEYFDNDGRGLYAYLTGAASWYMLTVITQVFGVKGNNGNLEITPALLAEQFGEKKKAVLRMEFAGRKLEICIENPQMKEYGEYHIQKASCEAATVLSQTQTSVLFAKKEIEALPSDKTHQILITVG